MKETPTRIVILGGGFAGVSTAIELGKLARRNPSIEVHLVNKENYFVFQPLLPEVVSGGLEPGHVLNAIRQLCPNVHFHCATVTEVDRVRRTVTVVGAEQRWTQILPYDHLVWSLGLTMDLSRVPGMAEHGFPIKTLGDAFHLRNHVLARLESADLEPSAERRRQLLSIVAIGGGFSGVETIAAVHDMVRSVLRFYPHASGSHPRVVLVHSGERILPEMDADVAAFAQRKLQGRGVEILLNRLVTEATDQGITLSDGSIIQAGTVICTAGNAPHPLAARLGVPLQRGRIVVDEYLRIQGEPNCWALGDAAAVPDLRHGGTCPTTAQYATRQGRLCARNIFATVMARPIESFQYSGLGQLTMIGRHAGAGQVLGLKVSGFVAWYLWRSIYFAKMPGLRSKIRVATDWAMEILFPRDITMLNLQRTEYLRREHFRSGEVILRQGEVAEHFYIIEAGEVEIVREDSGGGAQRLGTRKAGTSFGEVSLLDGVRRTATVQCLTAVDVIKVSRTDFMRLVKSHDMIRSIVEKDARLIRERDPHVTPQA